MVSMVKLPGKPWGDFQHAPRPAIASGSPFALGGGNSFATAPSSLKEGFGLNEALLGIFSGIQEPGLTGRRLTARSESRAASPDISGR